MKVLVLAAGYAVRLAPLTLNTPKPLLNVGKKTILDRIIDAIENVEDIDEVFIVTNHRFFLNFKEWLRLAKRKVPIRLIDDGSTADGNKLGAIGDMKLFVDRVGETHETLIIAGDNIFECSLGRFIEFGRSHANGVSIAVHDVQDTALAKKYGIVRIDREGKVVEFEEKPSAPRSTLASTCVYYFPIGKLGLLGAYVAQATTVDAPGNFIRWLKDNDRVFGFVFTEPWFDIGGIESLQEADKQYRGK